MSDQETPYWLDVLQKIIQPPKERQRIAAALGINKVTLTRWAQADSRPQRQDLAHLLKVVQPHHRAELLTALQRTFPDMYIKLHEENSEAIPSSFMREVLRMRASTIESLRSWQLGAMILDEAIRLLDPHQLGLSVTPALCMPPRTSTGPIRSLREQGGRGTFPWSADLEHKSLFLGVKSLAGHATQTARELSVRDTHKEDYIPVFSYPEDIEHSAAACPIWFEGKIAGCLLAASSQTEHFTQPRVDLLRSFADIFALTLTPAHFYEHSRIQLRYIPLPPRQHPLLQKFRPRVARVLLESGLHDQHINSAEAELAIWQEIEEELVILGAEEGDDLASSD